MNKKRKSLVRLVSLIAVVSLLMISGCSSAPSGSGVKQIMVVKKKSTAIVFADGKWASIKMHNRIAGYIIEHGYGYKPSYLAGENIPLFAALQKGEADVMMEVWTTDYPSIWGDLVKSGKVRELGTNFTGYQGWYIPTYIPEGDAERGIEPEIPSLKRVEQLPDYQGFFKLSPSSSKGIILNAPQDWPVAAISQAKLKNYGLAYHYALMPVESEAALDASLDQAYQRGEAWLGFCKDPGLLTAGRQLTQLQEDEYTEESWQAGYTCAYPECSVKIGANTGMEQKAPEILDFLQKYQTTRGQNEDMLLYVKKFGGDKAVREWLLDNPDVWSQWVSDDIARVIWNELNPPAAQKTSPVMQFIRKYLWK